MSAELDKIRAKIESTEAELEQAKKDGETGSVMQGWRLPSLAKRNLIWTNPPKAQTLETEQATYIEGVVHHSEKNNVKSSPDPKRTKLEILEYWDKGRKIMVLNQECVIYCGDNEFKRLPFLSANWWTRPRAFYGMGLGLIVGQNTLCNR